ncbi:16968_t:CDS:1, partial [Cetraspora pellucida]
FDNEQGFIDGRGSDNEEGFVDGGVSNNDLNSADECDSYSLNENTQILEKSIYSINFNKYNDH